MRMEVAVLLIMGTHPSPWHFCGQNTYREDYLNSFTTIGRCSEGRSQSVVPIKSPHSLEGSEEGIKVSAKLKA